MLESKNDFKISSRGKAKMHWVQHCRLHNIVLSYYNQFSHNILDTTNQANVSCTTVRLWLILSNHPMKMSTPVCTCKNYVSSLHCTSFTLRKASVFLLVIRFQGELMEQQMMVTSGTYERASQRLINVALWNGVSFYLQNAIPLTGMPSVHSICFQKCKEYSVGNNSRYCFLKIC